VRGVELPDDEVLAAFVSQFYGEGGRATTIPDEVVLPVRFEGADGVAEWLSERRGRRCELLAPQRGPRMDLLRLATENAEHAFREQRRARDDVEERLAQLQKRLRLPTLPRRIECCDISHIGGNDTVGAIVALKDGQPDKTRYRTFHVRTVAQGDDYGAMYEVLARRFRRGRAAKEAQSGQPESEAEAEGTRERIDWDLPDLFVVDGGRGQLNVALAAARDLGLHGLPIVGLAKEKTVPGYPARGAPERDHADGQLTASDAMEAGDDANAAEDPSTPGEGNATDEPSTLGRANATDEPSTEEAWPADEPSTSDRRAVAKSEVPFTPQKPEKARRGRTSATGPRVDLVDRVYLPGQKNGIPLQANSAPLFFLARARDEAHRFSNRARERLGKARKFRSQLDDIPGIGPVTRRALLRILGSLDGVRRASDEAILAVPGVSRKTLQAIRVHFPPPARTSAPPAASPSLGDLTPPPAASPSLSDPAPAPTSPPSPSAPAPASAPSPGAPGILSAVSPSQLPSNGASSESATELPPTDSAAAPTE
jgi:excinuclease ABC subunit C